MNDRELLEYFASHNHQYELYCHQPIFSAKDGHDLPKSIPGAHGKNLFLKDKKKQYYLVSLLEHKRVDLKRFSEEQNLNRLSFGNEVELMKFIGVTPGSVTPYGLIHDIEKQVIFYLDREILSYESINFHPLRNDQTVRLSTASFLRFFESINHKINIIDIPIIEDGVASGTS